MISTYRCQERRLSSAARPKQKDGRELLGNRCAVDVVVEADRQGDADEEGH